MANERHYVNLIMGRKRKGENQLMESPCNVNLMKQRNNAEHVSFKIKQCFRKIPDIK